MKALVFPRAIATAAKAFAKNPKMVGEIIVALVTDSSAKLNDTQRYILTECREEIAERVARRKADAERKRNSRGGVR